VFAWWGRTVFRYRYIVIGVMVALCLGGGVYGISLGQHVTQSGFYDEGSQSVHASVVSDKAYGRDTSGHIIGIYTAPEGKTVDDPAFKKKILDNLAEVEKNHPDQVTPEDPPRRTQLRQEVGQPCDGVGVGRTRDRGSEQWHVGVIPLDGLVLDVDGLRDGRVRGCT